MRSLPSDKKRCLAIKQLIESTAKIKDIGVRSKKRHMIEYKRIYCKLCSIYAKSSVSVIGEVLGDYDHASVLYHIKEFDKFESVNDLYYPDFYKKIESATKSLFSSSKKIILKKYISEDERRIRFLKMVEKNGSIIRKQRKEIEELKEEIKKLNNLVQKLTYVPSNYKTTRSH